MNPVTATTNTTHLLWVGRWIECVQVWIERDHEYGWTFKTGYDAACWLMWPEPYGEDAA
jgi:hypothetical protein